MNRLMMFSSCPVNHIVPTVFTSWFTYFKYSVRSNQFTLIACSNINLSLHYDTLVYVVSSDFANIIKYKLCLNCAQN